MKLIRMYPFLLMHLSMSSPRGMRSGKPREFDPRAGILVGNHAFDLSISNSRREVNHLFLLILTIIFRPNHDWL